MSAFIAPMILFFSLSGAMQIVGLQDAHGTYKPNTVISSIAGLHKRQIFAPEPQREGPPSSVVGSGAPPAQVGSRITPVTVLLKGLFLLEALALATTTLFGVWIGITHAKRARTCWLLLVAGTLVPLTLLIV